MKKLAFTADPALIRHIIESQAGTLTKAVMEGVMNSVDAQPKSPIVVTITPTHVTIEDDGCGFTSEQEITDNFGRMGRPHAQDEDGLSTDARFGRFRIGRGQMFAFGVNNWYTNRFHLHVDFRGCRGDVGYGYTVAPKVLHRGCKAEIELYDALNPGQIRSVEGELAEAFAYLDVPVEVNGRRVTKNPAEQKWDHVTPDAYIRRTNDKDGLLVYNDGILAERIPFYLVHVSGIVVSRKGLKLNTARNQVLRSHSVWQRIERKLHGIAVEQIRQRPIRDHASAARALASLQDGDLQMLEFSSVRAFPDVSGKFWSLSTMCDSTACRGNASNRFELNSDGKIRLAFAPAGDNMGDRMIQQRKALVLDQRILAWIDRKRLYEMLARYCAILTMHQLAELDTGDDHTLLDSNVLRGGEIIMFDAIHSLNWYVHSATATHLYGGTWHATDRRPRMREIRVGRSASAAGWTDGSSYIAIAHSWLAQRSAGRPSDFVDIVNLLVHEYCHEEATSSVHCHAPEFYEAFHEIIQDSGGSFAQKLQKAWEARLKTVGRSKSLIKRLDQAAAWQEAQLKRLGELEEEAVSKRTAKKKTAARTIRSNG